VRKALAGVVIAGGLVIQTSTPALAGGSWMYTIYESYQPGDHVTAVGYVGALVRDEDGPFLARLNMEPMSSDAEFATASWHDLGPVTVEATGLSGYLSSRLYLEFTLPADLVLGEYEVSVRDESGAFLGDLVGLWLLVGVEPSEPRWIEWALDEPLIPRLSQDTIIAGPGFAVTVSDLRDGRYPAGAESFMLNPETLDQPGIVTTTTPTTTTEIDVQRAVDQQNPTGATSSADPHRAIVQANPETPSPGLGSGFLLAAIAVVVVATVVMVGFRFSRGGHDGDAT